MLAAASLLIVSTVAGDVATFPIPSGTHDADTRSNASPQYATGRTALYASATAISGTAYLMFHIDLPADAQVSEAILTVRPSFASNAAVMTIIGALRTSGDLADFTSAAEVNAGVTLLDPEFNTTLEHSADAWTTDVAETFDVTPWLVLLLAHQDYDPATARLVFLIDAAEAVNKQTRAYESDPAKAATLQVTYTLPTSVQGTSGLHYRPAGQSVEGTSGLHYTGGD